MRSRDLRLLKLAGILVMVLFLSSCSVILQTGRRSDVEKIDQLTKQIDNLSQTRILLEERLKQEIADKQVRLEMAEKGLVITFVADILFDSGKAKIRQGAYPILDKVARVLSENVPELSIGVEGHTDNQPIKHSTWKSNWELSTARALSVLHYLVDQKGINPERVSALGFGEYKPVSPNDTKESRQFNRRVEIVIMPQVTKIRKTDELATTKKTELKEPAENLK